MAYGGQFSQAPQYQRRSSSANQALIQALMGGAQRAQGPWSAIGNVVGQAFAQNRQSKDRAAQQQQQEARQQATRHALSSYRQNPGQEALVAAMMQPNVDADRLFGRVGQLQSLFPQQPEAAPQETWGTVQSPYGRGGVAQESSLTGRLSGYQGPVAEAGAAEEPQGPFKGTGMDAQALNILLTGDPATAEYRAAFHHYGQPKYAFDPVSRQQTVVRQDMTAFKKPTFGAMATPAGEGAAPAGMGPPGGVDVAAMDQGAPRLNELQAKKASTADTTRASLEVLKSLGADGRTLFEQLSNPIDTLNPTSWGKSGDFERAEQAFEVLAQVNLRDETGAAMPAEEVANMMKRYRPRWGEEPETTAQKMAGLEALLERAIVTSGEGYEYMQQQRAAAPAPLPEQAAPPVVPSVAALIGGGGAAGGFATMNRDQLEQAATQGGGLASMSDADFQAWKQAAIAAGLVPP